MQPRISVSIEEFFKPARYFSAIKIAVLSFSHPSSASGTKSGQAFEYVSMGKEQISFSFFS